MNNFRFYAPTDIRFGKGQADCLPEELGKYGKRILMVYGGGSVKRSGLYDRLQELLKEFEIFELPGIEPNPKVTSVRKGVEICKKEQIDVILAVGGGSCIDASKNIACGAYYEGDPWDLVLDKGKIALDGTPAAVFSQVEKVKALGLDVPPMAELAMRLNAGGLSLPDGILTVADMVKELKKALCPSK